MFIGQNCFDIILCSKGVGIKLSKNNNNKIPRLIVIRFFLNYHLAEVGKLTGIVTFGI